MPDCGCCLTRRGFFAGAAGAAVAAPTLAAAPAPRGIVDVHAHYMAPTLMGQGALGPMNTWSFAKHLEEMDRGGVAKSVLSVTYPGVTNGEQARVRGANEFAARLRTDNPGRIGFFVYLDLNNIEASLRELEYGLDTLKGHGVGLFTSYNGKYLGDPAFDPVFAELNRRRATVYVHPVSGPCCTGVLPGVQDSIIEFGTDTTRAITRYVYGGAARKYPNVKMIWSHSGGTLPFLIERYDLADRQGLYPQTAPDGFRAELRKFYFDIAQASNPTATTALRSVVPVDHVLFGTDYPFRTPIEHVQALESGRVFNAQELAGVYRANAARDLPGLLAA